MAGMGFESTQSGINDPDLHGHMILCPVSLPSSHLSIKSPPAILPAPHPSTHPTIQPSVCSAVLPSKHPSTQLSTH